MTAVVVLGVIGIGKGRRGVRVPWRLIDMFLVDMGMVMGTGMVVGLVREGGGIGRGIETETGWGTGKETGIGIVRGRKDIITLISIATFLAEEAEGEGVVAVVGKPKTAEVAGVERKRGRGVEVGARALGGMTSSPWEDRIEIQISIVFCVCIITEALHT